MQVAQSIIPRNSSLYSHVWSSWKKIACLVAVLFTAFVSKESFTPLLPSSADFSKERILEGLFIILVLASIVKLAHLPGASILNRKTIREANKEYKNDDKHLTQQKSSKNTIQEPVNQDIKCAETLIWNELASLCSLQCSFGLRHVGSFEDAQDNLQKGFFGDALNLDFTACWEMIHPHDQRDAKGYNDLDYYYMNRTSESLKTQIMDFWQKGVSAFIQNCVTSTSAFLLINYGQSGKHAYDFHYGEGLGKKGKSFVKPNQILGLFPPSKTPLKENELLAYFYAAIIKELKSLSKK